LAHGFEMQLEDSLVGIELFAQAGEACQHRVARRRRLEMPERATELEQTLALAVVELAQVGGGTALQGGRLLVHDFLQAREAPLERARSRGAIAVCGSHVHHGAQLSHRTPESAVSSSLRKCDRHEGQLRSTDEAFSTAGVSSTAAGLRR